MSEFYRSQTSLIPAAILIAALSAAGTPQPLPQEDHASPGLKHYAYNYYLSQNEFAAEPTSVLPSTGIDSTPEIESGWNLLASVLLKDSRSMDAIERAALDECFWAA